MVPAALAKRYSELWPSCASACTSMEADHNLYCGLIRLHILHRAVEGPIFGLGMAEEPAQPGYKANAGTLV
jgi:hypothetical protein